MTAGPEIVEAGGDIVERQSYLNGTRYYLVEGEAELAGAAWRWTLSVTLPKEASEPITEGDLSLIGGDRSWFADIAVGSYSDTIDEALDTAVVAVQLSLAARADSDGSERWQRGIATAILGADTCELRLELLAGS